MDPISIAMALAQFVPGIIKLFNGSDKHAEIAQKVIEVAKAATGQDTGEAALAAMQADPAKVMEFQLAMSKQQSDLELAYLADTKDARDRDVKLVQAGQRNIRADSMYVLAVVAVICLVYYVVRDATLNEYTKGIITLVLGRFLGYLDQMYNFEWGTTRQSRAKDDTIAKLSKE